MKKANPHPTRNIVGFLEKTALNTNIIFGIERELLPLQSDRI
jgi:hypothetical protein